MTPEIRRLTEVINKQMDSIESKLYDHKTLELSAGDAYRDIVIVQDKIIQELRMKLAVANKQEK